MSCRSSDECHVALIEGAPSTCMHQHSSSGTNGKGSSLMEGLLAMLLSERMGTQLNVMPNTPPKPEVEALREQMWKSLAASIPSATDGPAPDVSVPPVVTG
jgi:hypothetical protein